MEFQTTTRDSALSTTGTQSPRRLRRVVAAVAATAMAVPIVTSLAPASVAAEGDTVIVTNEVELRAAVDSANGPTRILLEPGSPYVLTGPLTLDQDFMTIVGVVEGSSASASQFVIDANGGRGLDVKADDVTLRGVTVRNAARSNGSGAAINVNRSVSQFSLVDSAIVDNTAREGAGLAVESGATARVERSTFARNTVVRKGGGIRVDGSIEIVNSTFNENTGQSGGAISVAGEAEISFSTFVDNTSNNSKGGGVDKNGGTVVVTGSILTRANQASDAGSDCSGNPDLIGRNYVGNAQGCNPDESVLIGTDPDVGPLAIEPLAPNLGPTPTMAIAEGSVAIDKVDPSNCNEVIIGANFSSISTGMPVATDQRSVVRPQPADGGCDLGAYELTDLTVDVSLTSSDSTPFVGAELLPSGAIASSVIATDQLFGGSLEASPLSAFPLEAAPLSAFPLSAFPLSAFPLSAFPLSAFPLSAFDTAAAPLSAFPLSAFPLSAFPLSAFPLSDLVITDDDFEGGATSEQLLTWEELLSGTEFDGVPLQSLTLDDGIEGTPDVIDVPGVADLDIRRLNLEGTPLSAFPLSAFQLQSVPLSAFPLSAFQAEAPAGATIDDWCDIEDLADFCAAANPDIDPNDPSVTLASLALAGIPLSAFPLSAFPLSAFPLSAFPLSAFPLSAFPLSAFQWQASPLSAFPLSAFPLSAFADGFVDCAALPGGTCDGATLGDAYFAGALPSDATLEQLGSYLTQNPEDWEALGITLADVLVGVLPADSIPWDQLDLNTLGLQNAGSADRWTFDYLADVTLTGAAQALTLELTLPAGFAYAGTGVTVDGAEVDPPAVSLRCSDPTSDDCIGQPVVVVIELADVASGSLMVAIPTRAGFVVTEEDTTELAAIDVTATSGSTEATASDDHSVVVIAPADSGVRTIDASGGGCAGIDGDANLGWATSPDEDVDLYTFEVSHEATRCGLRADIFLSNLPIDLDLTLLGPVTVPLRQEPTASMAYLDDVVLDLNPFDDQIQADTVQDIPQRLPDDVVVDGATIDPDQFSVVAISSNRDRAADRIRTGTLRQGRYFIQVSAYNGESSNEPYALRMRTDGSVRPLACSALDPAPTAPANPVVLASGIDVPSPTDLPDGLNTLFLVNEQMLEYHYGESEKNRMIAAASNVAAASGLGVIGAVIPVDRDTGVAAALGVRYGENRCDPFVANEVVREIGQLIDTYTAIHDVENIVIVGDDRQIPMANIVDDANFANERTFSQEFDIANESTAALAAGLYRTDDPYGTDAGLRIRDHEVFVPTRAVGRLVETPDEIVDTLVNFVEFGGQLDEDTERTAFQSGYEFLEDGAALNADNLSETSRDRPFAVTTLFESDPVEISWRDDEAIAAMGSRFDVIGLHAHFDENNALPARENYTGVTNPEQLLSSDELPLAVDRAVVYSMGCHSGWSFSDVQVGPGASAPDWAQELTGTRSNVYAANTGFGYGDSLVAALTEQLTADFAGEIGVDGSIGAAWVAAKQKYASEIHVIDAYQEKALQQFVFYGLPMFHVDTPPPPALPGSGDVAALSTPAPAELAPPEIVEVETFNPLDDTETGFELNRTDDGDYFSIDDDTVTVNGHPVQPLRRVDLPERAGMRAQDALITDMSSLDWDPEDDDFDPLFFWASPNYGGPRPEFLDGSFPAEMASIRTRNVRGERSQQLLLAAGQYRAFDEVADLGTQRLHTFMETDVYYVDERSTDFTPPLIERSRGFVDGQAVQFEVDVDDTAERVYVLYRAEGAVDWDGVDLTFDALTGQWRGVGPFGGGGLVEYIVQSPDEAGNVAMSNSKSRYFLAAAPGDLSELTLTADGPTRNDSGWFTGDVTITATNGIDEEAPEGVDDGIRYRIDTGPFQRYLGDFTIDSDVVAATRLVTAVDRTGASYALPVKIDALAPNVTIQAESEWSKNPVTFAITALDQGSGVTAIYYATGNGDPTTPYTGPVEVSTEGVTTVTAIAVDVAGNESEPVTQEIRIDTTASEQNLDLTITGLDADGLVAAGAEVSASYTCNDALSGVASCVIAVDGTFVGDAGAAAAGVDSTAMATLPTTELGERTVTVTVTDQALPDGNTAQTVATYTVEDRTDPTATLTINGSAETSQSFPFPTGVSAAYSCDDVAPAPGVETSDIDSCVVEVDGIPQETGDATSGTIPLPGGIDSYSVSVTATDNAGNSFGTTKSYDVIDAQPAQAFVRNITVNDETGEVEVTYECTDNVAVSSCRLDIKDGSGAVINSDQTAGGAVTTFSFTLTTRGSYTSVVTATDTTGNPPGVATSPFTLSRLIAFCPLYDPSQTKNKGTNYNVTIELCPGSGLQPRNLELMAYLITDPATGARFDPGVNDSGNANDGSLFLFRNVRKSGFTYNLNTTGFTGTPSPTGTRYLLWFEVKDRGTTIGIGNAAFTLTP